MAVLIKHVVPKVAYMWAKVAWQLGLDTPQVNIIKKKCHDDPEDCCEEMFSYWLDSGSGKQWNTLLEALKGVTRLTAVTEEIESELAKLSQTADNH